MARVILHGIPVSSGIAMGTAFFLHYRPEVQHRLVLMENIELEVERLRAAMDFVLAEYMAARDAFAQKKSPDLQEQIDLTESHLLICKDPKLVDQAINRIRQQRMNAEWALEESVSAIAETFNRIAVPYIRERLQDVRAVSDRILQRLCGDPSAIPDDVEKGIILANDLTPADALNIPLERVVAFATEQGGSTSHTGILARGLSLPGVVGINGLQKDVNPGETIIVDGLKGKVLVSPTEAEKTVYRVRKEQFEAYQESTGKNARLPAETLDGLRISVLANVEGMGDTGIALKMGAEGVGLVRTEFAYIARKALPSEDDLFYEYAQIASAFSPMKVTFRTLDLGSDKVFTDQKHLEEANPAMGLRAIRYCLRHPEVFRCQLRAILRASAYGNVALMFPMISGLNELLLAKAVLNEAKQELDAAGIVFSPTMPVGVMIELPSAVFIADALAAEVDFFSIGTNDLIQYSLGIDRTNKHVNYLYQPLHPAIIKAIKFVVDRAHKRGISVSVCGEMAADPYCLPVLLGMPVDELSIAPQSIPGIKHIIRHSDSENCRELLNQVLSASSPSATNKIVRQAVYQHFPKELDFYSSTLGSGE